MNGQLKERERETPRAKKKIHTAHERHHVRFEGRQKREASNSHIRAWRDQDSETNFHLWTWARLAARTEDLQMHPRTRCTGWNEEQEEFATHRAYKLHKELFKTNEHCKDVHKTNFFRTSITTKAKYTATGLAIHSKERMYIVDSGAPLHMMEVSSLNHRERRLFDSQANFWIFRPPLALCSQTQANVYIKELGACLWVHLVKGSPSVLSLGRLCNELGYCCSWPTEETPRVSKGKKVIECNIEKLRLHGCRYHPLNSRHPRETLSENKKWRTPC